eukprot:6489020-Amphidinium_carterae.1
MHPSPLERIAELLHVPPHLRLLQKTMMTYRGRPHENSTHATIKEAQCRGPENLSSHNRAHAQDAIAAPHLRPVYWYSDGKEASMTPDNNT